jgi:hypothetical protein
MSDSEEEDDFLVGFAFGNVDETGKAEADYLGVSCLYSRDD